VVQNICSEEGKYNVKKQGAVTPTPRSRIILQKLMVAQLVCKFIVIYGTRKVHYRAHESLQAQLELPIIL